MDVVIGVLPFEEIKDLRWCDYQVKKKKRINVLGSSIHKKVLYHNGVVARGHKILISHALSLRYAVVHLC